MAKKNAPFVKIDPTLIKILRNLIFAGIVAVSKSSRDLAVQSRQSGGNSVA
jgi:hypothetical protein